MSVDVDDDALVTNAADEEQLAYARRKQDEQEAETRARWRQQLGDQERRRFIWEEVLPLFRLFEWIDPTDQAAVGVRNKGLEVWARVNEHPDLFLQMQGEAIKRAKQARAENAASRTAPQTRSA